MEKETSSGKQEARRLGSFCAVSVPFENAQTAGSKRNCFRKLKAAARATGGARGWEVRSEL